MGRANLRTGGLALGEFGDGDRAGARPAVEADGAIVASGLSSADIGELAADQELTVHELTPLRASLEDVFMELTSASVEYRSHTNEPLAAGTLPTR